MVEFIYTLTEKEIDRLIKEYANIDSFLKPIKENNKKYPNERKKLGRLKSDSPVVKKFFPSIIIDLYEKGDKNYVDLVDALIGIARTDFMEMLQKECEDSDVKNLTNEQLLSAIDSWCLKNTEDQLDLVLLRAQIKIYLYGDEERINSLIDKINNKYDMTSEEIDDVKNNMEEAQETNFNAEINKEIEEKNPQDGSEIIVEKPHSKTKKKTPQEKAEANRLALKKKEEMERLAAEQAQEENEKLDINKEIIESIKGELTTDISATIENEVKPEKKEVVLTSVKHIENCYLGFIDIRNRFYNFAPLGEWDGRKYYPFNTSEVDKLLPNSLHHNINLFYNVYDETRVSAMEDSYHQYQLRIFEFKEEELQENRDPNTGELNQTGYKISGYDVLKSKKMRFPSEDGLYALKSIDILVDDLKTSKSVRLINDDQLTAGEKILINMKNGFYAGPYEVKFSATRQSYFIQTQGTQENKYLLSGYSSADVDKVPIDLEYEDYRAEVSSWDLYYIHSDAVPEIRDVVTDEVLLEDFQATVNNRGGSLSGNNLSDAIANYKSSLISGEDIPENIKKDRLRRIEAIISSKENLDGNFAKFSNILVDMMLNNADSEQTSMLIETIVSKRPDFLDKISGIRIVKDRIDSYRNEIENLEMQKLQMQQEVEIMHEEAKKKAEENVEAQDKNIKAAEERLSRLTEKLGIEDDLSNLDVRKEEIQKDVEYLESHKRHLEQDTRSLETSFVDIINQYATKVADITFDGFMSSKLLQAASEWENNEEDRDFKDKTNKVNAVEAENFTKEELIDYVVSTVNKVRPQYDRNMVINLLICIVQGFITVFSGAPGSGKTSICNIIGKTLGLKQFEKITGETDVDRYIPVSVERGWTSKRDFVGYYNPLTKAFEESNREVFDGLRMLNREALDGINKYMYMILLDEANLSSMEYYWADFMNVCDDLSDNHQINLGNGNIFNIPETLHFVATINNDHTTETLSPRLINRAWVVTLPKLSVISYTSTIPDDEVKLVSWKNLKEVFGTKTDEKPSFDSETQKAYDLLKKKLNEVDINISPRIDIAIHRYWCTAVKIMKEDELGMTPGMIAFDFIVAQKILPMINGSGDEYENWLISLNEFCAKYNLVRSADILKTIIDKGNKQLKYYQFFN